jgi:hypothetical protein
MSIAKPRGESLAGASDNFSKQQFLPTVSKPKLSTKVRIEVLCL